MSDFAARRAEAESELAELQAAQGEAILSGEKFDTRRMVALEAEIRGLRSAEGAQARRDRAEAKAARHARIDAARTKLAATYSRYLHGIANAYSAFVDARTSLQNANVERAAMVRICHEIGVDAPMPLSGTDWASRLSLMLGASMSAMEGHKHRFGGIAWPASFFDSDTDWRQAEERLLAPHIEPLTGDPENDSSKRKTNGSGNGRAD